ncbi:hypothetical protein ColLi_12415 [Colletotrichum liriopes]|uniref:Uncharacterized protein n=1 Tax=Colletotrichum liriopes TaxID=708192 RepID=A0AA37LYN0_9PEZI|nr:hypothetical protein ColLi_12415 [Colletotrichum liriopes]
MAEMMKMFGIWHGRAKVQDIVERKLEDPEHPELQRLAEAVTRASKSETFPAYPSKFANDDTNQVNVVAVHSLYHMCQVVLHSSTVPLFSGKPRRSTEAIQSVWKAADITVRHAISHAQLLREHLKGRGDFTRINPVTGFTGFISASVLLAVLKCQDRRRGNTNHFGAQLEFFAVWIQDAIHVLEILGAFWDRLRPLITKTDFVGIGKPVEKRSSKNLACGAPTAHAFTVFESGPRDRWFHVSAQLSYTPTTFKGK